MIYRGTLLTHRIFPKGKAQGVFGSTVVTAGLIARALTGRAPETRATTTIRCASTDDRHLDGQRLEAGEFQLLMATTLHRLFAGIRPFWGKGPGGIRFTALAARLLPPAPGDRQGAARPRAADAPPTPASLYESRNVEKVELTLDCGISLDGEMFAPRDGPPRDAERRPSHSLPVDALRYALTREPRPARRAGRLPGEEHRAEVPREAIALADEIRRRHGDAVAAIFFYGSCLRRAYVEGGVLDFYAVVDSYRAAYRSTLLALSNSLLPPNVYYVELPFEGGTLRMKYNIISQADFSAACRPESLHPIIWARFCQPAAVLLGPRRGRLAHALAGDAAEAAVTMVSRMLALHPEAATTEALWQAGFGDHLHDRDEGREPGDDPVRLRSGARALCDGGRPGGRGAGAPRHRSGPGRRAHAAGADGRSGARRHRARRGIASCRLQRDFT